MIEPAVGAGHARCDAHPGARQGSPEKADELRDRRRGPARIDEFMRELDVPDADAIGNRIDQIVRIGEAVDQRIGVQRKREGQGLSSCSGLPDKAGQDEVRLAAVTGKKRLELLPAHPGQDAGAHQRR